MITVIYNERKYSIENPEDYSLFQFYNPNEEIKLEKYESILIKILKNDISSLLSENVEENWNGLCYFGNDKALNTFYAMFFFKNKNNPKIENPFSTPLNPPSWTDNIIYPTIQNNVRRNLFGHS